MTELLFFDTSINGCDVDVGNVTRLVSDEGLDSDVLLDGGRKSMLVGHLNIRSVLPKDDELNLLLESGQNMVLGLSETWLDETIANSEVDIPGFKLFRKDRNRRGGGVMVYASHDLTKVERRSDLEDDSLEAL